MVAVNSSSTASLGARSREELRGAAAVCLGCLSLRWRQPCVCVLGGGGFEDKGVCVICDLAVGPWISGVCAWDKFGIVPMLPQSLGIPNLVLPKSLLRPAGFHMA